MSGEVVHFEVPVKDLKRAKKFYGDVFGWQFTEVPEMEYTLVNTTPSDENGRPKEPGSINGGMGKKGRPLLHPIITLEVDDIDKALKSVEANGGNVEQKKLPVGDMGWTAYFKDSEGNIMGLWQSKA